MPREGGANLPSEGKGPGMGRANSGATGEGQAERGSTWKPYKRQSLLLRTSPHAAWLGVWNRSNRRCNLEQHCADLQKAVEEKDPTQTASSWTAWTLQNLPLHCSECRHCKQPNGSWTRRPKSTLWEAWGLDWTDQNFSAKRWQVKDFHSPEVGPTLGPDSELQRQVDSWQESLMQQCKMNAELQEEALDFRSSC